jgi:malonyl CoA-acyl carrier protein transacylase
VQDYQLELSVSQTPRHCLIAGPSTELERWAKSESSRFSARVRPMYPFPIHTSWMNPVLDKIFHNIIEACADPKWKIPMFSTIHCRPIVSRADLLRDTMDNIVSAVRWAESVQSLAKAGYDRFINIGPAATLVSFIQNSPIANEVQTEDSFAPFLPAKQQIGGMNATVFA